MTNVPMVITQGEDYTSDVIWTDNFDEPINVVHPCRLDVKDSSGQTILTFETDTELPEQTVPSINLSPQIGLIQLHVTREHTAALNPGNYHYDLFVTTDDGDEYAGPQVIRLLYGETTVNKRVTVMQ